ncbi:hypothetical protein DXG03_001455 [Asterophora parasitica]|uniref:BZIP domain-containing protein n=1 Tax=Asterophora parasitica TaxID=117018 RepID=A0A9P7KFP7_9AGAR|nr:hypothetical protein DXG03_001455 [Asterophora parasitica]
MPGSPSLPMSQIIASDAPLLSPLTESAPWDALYAPSPDTFSQYYIPASPSSTGSNSPPPSARMLKMRMSPDSVSENEQLCLPTHQVFDFPELFNTPAETPAPQRQERLSISINPAAVAASIAAKRSASPAPSLTKKPRAVGERISSKDFVPPDVSGLSKREARLVKNRAAAFLSRQRKREEFETMEIRVAELEQENARLLALSQLTQTGTTLPVASDSELISEIETLKAQLAEAKERERQLSAQLISKAQTTTAAPVVKVEETEMQMPLSPSTRSSTPSPHKSGASLGLMVLLCALPTLLSMPMNSAVPKSFAIPDAPLPAVPPVFDFNNFVSNDYDWSRSTGSSLMDLDDLDMSSVLSSSVPAPSSTSTSRKLEFSTAGADLDTDNGLGNLDISFDTHPADNGKIRVRIHPSSSSSSRAASPGLSDSKSDFTSWHTESETSHHESPGLSSSLSSQSSLASLSSSSSSSLSPYLTPPSPKGDPFLGVGASSDYPMTYPNDPSDMMFGQMDDSLPGTRGDFGQDVSYGSEYSVGDSASAKRRVRIALKSLPAAGGEGGEWEVQLC